MLRRQGPSLSQTRAGRAVSLRQRGQAVYLGMFDNVLTHLDVYRARLRTSRRPTSSVSRAFVAAFLSIQVTWRAFGVVAVTSAIIGIGQFRLGGSWLKGRRDRSGWGQPALGSRVGEGVDAANETAEDSLR